MDTPLHDDDQARPRQGTIADLTDLDAALEAAFDYRGDVSIQVTDGRTIEGYVFDLRRDVPESYVRMIAKDGSGQLTIHCVEVTRLAFTGRDTAAGKNWETWVKKYREKKCAEADAIRELGSREGS